MIAVTFSIPDFALGFIAGGITVFVVMFVIAFKFGKNQK